MNIAKKPIDLLHIGRRVLSEWQYQCPYVTNEKLTTIQMKLEEGQPFRTDPNDTPPGFRSEGEDEPLLPPLNGGAIEASSSSSKESDIKPSSPSASSSSSSSSATSFEPPPATTGATFVVQRLPGTKITTAKTFFEHCRPPLKLNPEELEALYWGLRFRTVPIASSYFCYAILEVVKLLEIQGFTGLLLPNGKLIPMCNLRIRKFTIQPVEYQQKIWIIDKSTPESGVSDGFRELHTQTEADLAEVEHSVIIARCLDGEKYVIDLTLTEFTLPMLQLKRDIATGEKYYVRDEVEAVIAGIDETEPGIITHGSWDWYVDHLQACGLFGFGGGQNPRRVYMLKSGFGFDAKSELFKPEEPLENFRYILYHTSKEVPSYANASHSLIARVVVNIWDEACANCGEIERGAGDKDNWEPVELYTCGGCKQARYCGQECQQADLKRHREQCQRMKPRKRKLSFN